MIRKRIRSYKSSQRGNVKSWHNALVGVPAFLIGNAPSLSDVNLSSLKHKYFTIGINRTFLLIDTTVLIWQDAELWWNHRAKIMRLKALKYCRDLADPRGKCFHFKLTSGDYAMPDDPSVLHGRGSTGPLAFQLAYSLGCDPIVLLGMDCKYTGGKTDFYGTNPSHKPYTLRMCSRGLRWIKKNASGRTIVNCSDNNVFTERLSLENVISKINPKHAQTRQDLIKQLIHGS